MKNLYYAIVSRVSRIIFTIKNLINWFPIIYKDKNWDFCYIYEILENKLKNVLKRTEKVKFYVGWEQDAKYLRICLNLIKKLKDEEYTFEHFNSLVDYIYYNQHAHREAVKYINEHSNEFSAKVGTGDYNFRSTLDGSNETQ